MEHVGGDVWNCQEACGAGLEARVLGVADSPRLEDLTQGQGRGLKLEPCGPP